MTTSTEILFISHGGGPLPLMGDPSHQGLVTQLKTWSKIIKRPKAILLISAHWETSQPSITAGANPSLIYDYSGFPAETYSLKYPCPGAPQLAAKVHAALEESGISANLDVNRGYDHGVFVPLTIMYPEADIPVIQLSLVNSLDPQIHIEIGKALNKLDEPDLLILGSGFSFHNMRAFFAAPTETSQQQNIAFEHWLSETLENAELTEQEREQRLIDWAQAPHARYAHPREEHLLPLHVCYGAAGKACDQSSETVILNKSSGMFYWAN
jgi:aromatic ring-opening dioxygenase catalytic subunit (LigB family)